VTAVLGGEGGAVLGGEGGAAMPQAPWHLGDVPGVEATLRCGSGRAGVGQNGGSAVEQGRRAMEQGGCGAGP
jgi:hypothetical protein